MYLKLNGIEMNCTGQEKWRDLLPKLPDGGAGALGVSVRGRTQSLNDPVEEYAFARTLTFADEEGRRIYERSLQFVFLTAVHLLYPGERVRIRHSFGRGIYIDLPGVAVTPEIVALIKTEMRRIIAADLPIEKIRLSTEEAKEYFTRTGQTDRLRILGYRRFSHFTLYRIDGLEDYFYGEMTPSTGLVNVFDLKAYDAGIILQRPDAAQPDRPARFVDLPHLMHTYSEAAEWHAILNCENAADLNDMIVSRRLREFIRVNEALQERRIQQIADQFIKSGAQVLLIAGPSSSGKTTFSHRLSIALRVHGLRPVKISLDDYYLDRDSIPREPDGSIDLERIETLDLDLLCDHLPRLLRGETVDVPEFDFKSGKRAEHSHAFSVEQGQPVIIEGIHGLNDRLTATVPPEKKFKVYISPLTMLNLDDHNRIRTTDARLLRRIVRDNLFRGTPPEDTMAMWASVRRGEEKYIFPFQEKADAMFNSALTYELVIMKKYAYPQLLAITEDSPHYTLARRLVKFLNYIQTADVEDEIPVNSILREFIGGCCFYKDED
ncbi:MAG: nucleoside kinase [Clostridia bacterium]|nr:nucleoside kinase [Clostridia bacterium]MBR6890487.1 nucleoside kinase [Clostridia bacterium]